jgi:hypothetical protein
MLTATMGEQLALKDELPDASELPVVRTLAALVGAPAKTVRAHYRRGEPAHVGELGTTNGVFLAIEPLSDAKIASAVLRALASPIGRTLAPWKGKSFAADGGFGKNILYGFKAFGFRVEEGASALDGKPTTVLRYGARGTKNPPGVRLIVDELRRVGDGVAIGPMLLSIGKRPPIVVAWFGLETR